MRMGRVSNGEGPHGGRRHRHEEAGETPAAERAPVLSLNTPPDARPPTMPPSQARALQSILSVPLPSQKEMLKRYIRPRQLVDLIVSTDLVDGYIDVRRSVIEDIDGQGRLLLAQPEVPLLRAHVGQEVELTFLDRRRVEGRPVWMRVGYRAPILGFLTNHRLSAGSRVTVVMVDQPSGMEACTLRLFPRLLPSADMDLRLSLMPQGMPVRLEDISAGGLRFGHESWVSFQKGSRLRLGIHSGGFRLTLNGQVVREEPTGRAATTAVCFVDMPAEDRRLLQRLTHEIARHLLALRSQS